MPEKEQRCPKKHKIDKLAKEALDEIRKIKTTDRKLEMQLDTVEDKLEEIMGDHHLL